MSEYRVISEAHSSSTRKSNKYPVDKVVRSHLPKFRVVNSYKMDNQHVSRPKVNQVLPKQEEAEKKNYLQFMAQSVFKNNHDWRVNNLPHIYIIMTQGHKSNGLISIVSEGNWQNFVKKIRELDSFFANKTSQQILTIYIENVLEFQFFIANKILIFMEGVEQSITIKEALFLPCESHLKSKQSEYLDSIIDKDVAVFREGLRSLSQTEQSLTFERIADQIGQIEIDMYFRNNNISKNQIELAQQKVLLKMKISQYIEYLSNFRNISQKNGKLQNEQFSKILHSEQFIPYNSKSYKKFCLLLQKSFLSPYYQTNILSFISQDYSGLKYPSISFNCQNTWQGGKQQKMGFSIITINHGPDSVQWFVISKDDFFHFRNAVQKEFNIDINEREEGFFFDSKWLIEKGCSFTRILQKQSDIVFIGPGAYYWKRSFGSNIISTWKILLPSYQTFKEVISFIQHKQNQIKRQQLVIPQIKSLLFNYLIHNHEKTEDKSLQLLTFFFTDLLESEFIVLDKLIKKQKISPIPRSIYLRDKFIYLCEICKKEVFNYFVYKLSAKSIVCVQCFQSSSNDSFQLFQVAFKYDPYSLSLLFKDIKSCQKQWLALTFCLRKQACSFDSCKRPKQSKKRPRKEDIDCEKIQQQSFTLKNIKQFIHLNKTLSQSQSNPKISQILKLYNIQNNKMKGASAVNESFLIKCPNCKFNLKNENLPSKKKKKNEAPQCYIINDCSNQSFSTISTPNNNLQKRNSKFFKQSRYVQEQSHQVQQNQMFKERKFYERNSSKRQIFQRDGKISSNYQKRFQSSSSVERNYKGQNQYGSAMYNPQQSDHNDSNYSNNYQKRRQNTQYYRRNQDSNHNFHQNQRNNRKPTSDLQTAQRKFSQTRINFEPSSY